MKNLIMKIEFGKPFIDREERSAVEKTLRQPVLVHGKNTSILKMNFVILPSQNILLVFLLALLVFI